VLHECHAGHHHDRPARQRRPGQTQAGDEPGEDQRQDDSGQQQQAAIHFDRLRFRALDYGRFQRAAKTKSQQDILDHQPHDGDRQ